MTAQPLSRCPPLRPCESCDTAGGRSLQIFTTVALLLIAAAGSCGAQARKGAVFSPNGTLAPNKTIISWAKHYKQGCNMTVWLSNQMEMGIQAWENNSVAVLPPEPCAAIGIGMDYPVGACIEHLWGGGPWIAGVVDGVRRADEGYNGDVGDSEFYPEPKDSTRDRIWRTSVLDTLYDLNYDPPRLLKQSVNKRFFDDDHDGKIDEDDLDGLDNDGDWNPLTDDVGSDGVPDSLETGCDGKAYDPVTNPDPAYDNYDPGQLDLCRQLPNGSYPRRSDKNLYTEKNGLPDHGEPHVDEDYGAISENDIYLSSTDTFKSAPILHGHVPMGMKVIQHSYSWCGSFAEGILPMDYWFVNIGNHVIMDVYIGFFVDMEIGPINAPDFWNHEFSGYYPDLLTGYSHNAMDRGSTPAGITVLGASRRLDSLRYVWQWFDFSTRFGPGTDDSLIWSWMSCEHFGYHDCIAPDQSPTLPSDSRFFFAFGPFNTMYPGDSLNISVALVAGEALDIGPNNLRDNARNALKLYKRGYVPPVTVPAPSLRITEGFKKVTLEWGHHLCPTCPDPTQIWDDSNRIAEADPVRSANPPPGHWSGGRIFEGYRLYRSEDPSGDPPAKSFTLLKQWDLKGDRFEYNVGIDSVYTDTNLVRGKRYWYSVTAFGLPDITVLEIPDSSGRVRYDTLYSENNESYIKSSAKQVDLSFSVSKKMNEVLVVPNPYRVDQDYTYENGGWEGRARDWSENRRMLKFIHLPPRCTIRVFTLAGDLVTTLKHDDPVKGEVSWNLLSESNRALASGVYVFTVESELGRQIGKFVLIR